jgi:hypothetical protein
MKVSLRLVPHLLTQVLDVARVLLKLKPRCSEGLHLWLVLWTPQSPEVVVAECSLGVEAASWIDLQ